jgi:mono/diheme cytochrome c family protein
MANPDYAMEHGPGAKALLWFQRFVWLGIFANVIITLTAIFCTEWVIEVLRLDPAFPLAWPRFGAFGILLLTGFYLIVAMDPCRSLWASVFTILCRLGGLLFFAIVGGRYIVFGLYDLAFGAPQAVCLYLAWRKTREAALKTPPRGRWVVGLIVLCTLGAFVYGAMQFTLKPLLTEYRDDAEFFKYGSIGNDGAAGLPYPIWVALPEVCARHFPPGPKNYTAFGFNWERDADRTTGQPIGFSRAKVGVERMSINCAICHTARARLTADAEPQIYVGAATNTVDIQGYQRFLSNCAVDEDFTADKLLPAMEKRVPLGFFERLLYRHVLIPAVRKQLKKQGDEFAWSKQRPLWGPGRIDPFNPVKFGMLGLTDDGTIGNSDMMPLWNLAARESGPAPLFHWDGLTSLLRDSVLSSMLGDGTVAAEYRPETLVRLITYVRTLKAPASPHKPDPKAVERGRSLFAQQCAACHAAGGERTGKIIPPAEIGTDIQRNYMWTEAAVKAYTGYKKGYDWNFTGFRKDDGYLATTLDGLWLNGPYLHNGSVPTLRDLLKVPAERPVTFTRGGDLVDGKNGGFVSPPCDPAIATGSGFCYDTRLIGNSNAGHAFGTMLPQADKDNLLAYLLTL